MALASPARVRNWVGVGLAAAFIQTMTRLAVTAFLARLLTPEDFGLAALALSVAAMLTMCVDAPYEEALAQRQTVRRSHLEALIGAALLVGLGGWALLLPISAGMALWFERPEFLPIMMSLGLLLMLASYTGVLFGMARRWRRFELIELSRLFGTLVGGLTAGLLGWLGLGIWALIAMPIATAATITTILLVGLGLRLRPRVDRALVAPYWRFGRYILVSRSLDSLTYLTLNGLVGHLFGLAGLGYFNMAMRVIEPLRGVAGPLGNNLGYPFFKAARGDSRRMNEAVHAVSSRSAILSAPAFLGLAAVSPLLVPLLAGPGWEPAIPIAVLLALGGMLLIPLNVIRAAVSAAGRPRSSVQITISGFIALVAALLLFAQFGPTSAGIARLLADLVQALTAVLIGRVILGARLGMLVGGLIAPWGAAGLMAGCVFALGLASEPVLHPWLTLFLSVLVGAAVYTGSLFVLDRRALLDVLAAMRGRPAKATAAAVDHDPKAD